MQAKGAEIPLLIARVLGVSTAGTNDVPAEVLNLTIAFLVASSFSGGGETSCRKHTRKRDAL